MAASILRAVVNDPVEPLLAKQTATARALIQALRALIRQMVPNAIESVNMGWEVVLFSTSEKMKDTILAILPRAEYVNVQFYDGTVLPDPGRRLEGTGKRLRHVKVRRVEDTQDAQLRALIEAAVKLRGQ